VLFHPHVSIRSEPRRTKTESDHSTPLTNTWRRTLVNHSELLLILLCLVLAPTTRAGSSLPPFPEYGVLMGLKFDDGAWMSYPPTQPLAALDVAFEDRYKGTGYATRNAVHWPLAVLGTLW
jgi:hypothetical protein